jgi:hypothetical protein
MFKFFLTRYAFKQRPISEAAAQEARQALEEIKKLGASNNLKDLTRALVLISDAEMKYPFFQATAFYCRGEVVGAMTKHPDFIRKHSIDINPSPKP